MSTNPKTFDVVYHQYITPIYKYVYARIKHREEAEDIVHTVFIKAFEASRKKDIDVTVQYLFTLARTTVIDFWRKKKSIHVDEPEKVFDNIADDRANAHIQVELDDDVTVVQEALKKLDGEQKDVIAMRFVSDLTTKEIAQIVNKTESAVRKIQSRAIHVLRDEISFNDI